VPSLPSGGAEAAGLSVITDPAGLLAAPTGQLLIGDAQLRSSEFSYLRPA
jgi:hypothetical protein